MAKSIREIVAENTFTNEGQRPRRDWIERGEHRTEIPLFEEPENKTPDTPNLSKMVRATVRLRPRTDPAALVLRAEPSEMDRLAAVYHSSAAALLNPKSDKAGAQKAFDNAAMAIIRSGNPLPANGNLIKAGVTSDQVKAGLKARYGSVERSGPSSDLRPSPVPQLDAWGMPRMTHGIDPRAAVRRTMGLL